MQNRFRRPPLGIYLQTVKPFGNSFNYKRPEHVVNHLRPHSDTVQEERSRARGECFILILNDAILVMRSHATESQLLTFSIHGIDETIV